MLNLMKTLTAVRGISGYEKAVSDKLMMTVAPLCDRVYNDAMGSLIAYRQGSAPEGERRSVMLCAHMDEIGFLVTLIDDNGFIRVAPVGGIHCVAAAYATVVFGNGTKGVLVPEAGTAPADLKTEKMYVDIGAKDKREAERKVKIGDLCALEGSLTRLTAYSTLARRPIDMQLAREALRELFNHSESRRITCDIIQDAVASYYGVSVDDIKSARRSHDVTVPRQIAMYLSREMLGLSLTKIGDAFGGRHYTTVMSSIEKVEDSIKQSPSLASLLDDIRRIIKDTK